MYFVHKGYILILHIFVLTYIRELWINSVALVVLVCVHLVLGFLVFEVSVESRERELILAQGRTFELVLAIFETDTNTLANHLVKAELNSDTLRKKSLLEVVPAMAFLQGLGDFSHKFVPMLLLTSKMIKIHLLVSA